MILSLHLYLFTIVTVDWWLHVIRNVLFLLHSCCLHMTEFHFYIFAFIQVWILVVLWVSLIIIYLWLVTWFILDLIPVKLWWRQLVHTENISKAAISSLRAVWLFLNWNTAWLGRFWCRTNINVHGVIQIGTHGYVFYQGSSDDIMQEDVTEWKWCSDCNYCHSDCSNYWSHFHPLGIKETH